MTTPLVTLRFAAAMLALAGAVLLAGGQQAVAQSVPAARPAAAPAPARAPAIVGQPSAAAPPAAARPPAPPLLSPPPGDFAGGEVIARLGNLEVRSDEVRAIVAALGPQEQAAVVHDPSLLTQIVRSTLANQLVLKEALAKKWDQQPQIAAMIQRARDNAIAESYLRSLSVPPPSYPGDADVQSVYDANKSALLMPRQFQLAQIFVALAKDADKAAEDTARKKLDEVEKKVKAPGADFAAIAKTDSEEGESASRGGEIGWLPETQIRPEIRSQVIGLAKGAVAEPLKLDDGWHVLKLLDTKASYTRPLEEVRDALVQRMRAERADAIRRAYVAELLKQNPPAINELALTKLVQPAEH
jgi:parvulin-like peptidyl-prolyl isomerase